MDRGIRIAEETDAHTEADQSEHGSDAGQTPDGGFRAKHHSVGSDPRVDGLRERPVWLCICGFH